MLSNTDQLRRVGELWEEPARPNADKNPAEEAEARRTLRDVFLSLDGSSAPR
jgi:hypothetical protein